MSKQYENIYLAWLNKKKPGDGLRGRCNSFVVETDVHYPTDTNLLWDAMSLFAKQ